MVAAVIIQARRDSKRLPGKTLLGLGGMTVLEQVIARAKLIRGVSEIIVAIADEPENMEIINAIRRQNAKIVVGPSEDVLARYVLAARQHYCSIIVRITADCPLFCPHLVSRMLKQFRTTEQDIITISAMRDYPHGLEAEIFTRASLELADRRSKSLKSREHVSTWLKTHSRRRVHFAASEEEHQFRNLRLTLDYTQDFKLLAAIWRDYNPQPGDSWLELAKELAQRPDLTMLNRAYVAKKPRELKPGWILLPRDKQVN